MKQLVIFDLDGTLINSIKDLGAATNFALEKNGFPTHPLEAYPMYVGNGVSKLIERALPEDQRNEAMIKKIRADFTTYYDIHNHAVSLDQLRSHRGTKRRSAGETRPFGCV